MAVSAAPRTRLTRRLWGRALADPYQVAVAATGPLVKLGHDSLSVREKAARGPHRGGVTLDGR